METTPNTPNHNEHEPMPEGEEAPPAGVRAMAIVRWLFVAAMAGAAAMSVLYYLNVFKPSGASAAGAVYYCPMHPSVVQDGPGECPICGMNLVLRDKPGAGAGTSQKPSALPPGHEGHRHNPSDPYYCPMEPEETALNATDRCPVCNMKLKARAVDGGATGAVPTGTHVHGGASAASPTAVAGLQTVEIPADRAQLMGIRTARAARETLTPELKAAATLTSSERGVARVHTRVSGWIERIDVLETGRTVARGQRLVAIYSPEVYAAAVDHLNAVRWEIEEKKRFASSTLSHGGGHVDLKLASATRKRLTLLGVAADEIAAIETSGVAARQINVRAPASGTITRKGAVLGLYVQPGTELFEITDLSSVWAIADILENDATSVKKGQTARVRFAAYPDETFNGKVDFIYPALATDGRSLRVRIVLANKAGKLRPGMFGNVTLDLPSETGVFIPIEAVADSGDRQVVFLARPAGRFEPRVVKLGRRMGDRVLVKQGLADGDVVVTTGNFLLDSESRLRTALEGMK